MDNGEMNECMDNKFTMQTDLMIENEHNSNLQFQMK